MKGAHTLQVECWTGAFLSVPKRCVGLQSSPVPHVLGGSAPFFVSNVFFEHICDDSLLELLYDLLVFFAVMR